MRTAKLCGRVIVTLVIIVFCLLPVANAAETTDNPFDLSKYSEQVDKLGVPTRDSVDKLGTQAINAFESGDYEKALPVLQEWARQANWLSNLVVAGLQPFYTASYDDRKYFSKTKQLIPFESYANKLKEQRNHAMVMQAECLVKLGRTQEAVGLYAKTLDLLPVSDWDWWSRAANGLYAIIGVDRIPR